jgi:hypothetical protein
MKAQQQHRWAAAEKNETIQKEKKSFRKVTKRIKKILIRLSD